MKVRYSIVTRFALFFTGLLIFCILLTGYLVFNRASGVIVAYSQERILHASELAEQSFYSLLNEVSNDIALIASSPTLQNYVNQPTEKTKDDIEHLFRSTLENKRSYFQIRLIGIENNGKEIIRFDKRNKNVFAPKTLQEKGNLDYFKETVKINQGALYFSKINLNEEYGVISDPPTPTVRAASPIFNSDEMLVGILVINVSLVQLYRNLAQISGNESKFYLIDNQGQYLYAPDKEKQFGIQTHLNHNFFSDFQVPKDSLLSSSTYFGRLIDDQNEAFLSFSKRLSYFQEKRSIVLISAIQQNVLLRSAHAVRDESIQTLFWVCVFSIFMSWFFVSFFSKKIVQVTQAIANYDKGISDDIDLPTNRKDEIGVLASTFTKMKTKIDHNLRELNAVIEKEKEARKQKDEFLQNMSHEMRTPLNAILGLTQLLRKQSPPESQLPIIASLERSATNLAGLMYDVLDHQKLVEGKLEISYKPTDIAELISEIHANYEYDALQKGLDFQVRIEKKLRERPYQTDSLRLSQIVTNLVINALKYTQKGSVILEAKIIPGKKEILEIRVKDTGIGILPENIAKINERFFREKQDLSGRYGGYGLGLSIVKQLTELFGGTLRATSKTGEGSEFFVKIPITEAQWTTSEIKSVTKNVAAPQLTHNYKILYIEDDASTAELIKYMFNTNKLVLTHVKDIESASLHLERDSPDLVISDLMIEDQSLVDLLTDWITTKKIHCPLILISALEPKIMKSISKLYFQKPFDTDNLVATVYQLLGSQEFETPDFSVIYANYDNEAAKITKVLKLLREEFETYLDRINKAAVSQDQNEWDAILHKLIAHINTLSLTDFKKAIPKKVTDLNDDDLYTISNIFSYYICCFKAQEHYWKS
ncbi:ATP-binding protein [Pareuzebyella sediminis]|uniref:ATP-binding protein n=1 Tax=Pareuzebyella sediminis TaxID=2607998 RepID=UPI0011EDA827|nr:ATP-binding protein [Pareuzebyella sediminis]